MRLNTRNEENLLRLMRAVSQFNCNGMSFADLTLTLHEIAGKPVDVSALGSPQQIVIRPFGSNGQLVHLMPH